MGGIALSSSVRFRKDLRLWLYEMQSDDTVEKRPGRGVSIFIYVEWYLAQKPSPKLSVCRAIEIMFRIVGLALLDPSS